MRSLFKQATFGSFDGMTSLLGILVALVVSHTNPHTVLVASAGLAIAAAVGMGGGEYLSDSGGPGGLTRASVMTGATFAGAFIPVLPYLWVGGRLGFILTLAVIALISVAIAEIRTLDSRRVKAYAQTFVIVLLASGLSIGVSILLGVNG